MALLNALFRAPGSACPNLASLEADSGAVASANASLQTVIFVTFTIPALDVTGVTTGENRL